MSEVLIGICLVYQNDLQNENHSPVSDVSQMSKIHVKKVTAESMIEDGQKHAVHVIYVCVFVLYSIKAKIRHLDLSFNLLTKQLISYRLCSRNES